MSTAVARTQTGGDATAGITAHSERAARRFAAWLMQVIEPRGGWTPRRVLGRVTLALLAATSPVGLPLIVVLVLLKERHPIAHALGRGVSRLARASARAVRGRVGRAATWRAPVSGREPARATPEIAGYRDTLRAIARAERPTRVEVLARVALLRHPDRRDAEALDYRWALEQVIRYRESGRAKAPVEVAREFARQSLAVFDRAYPHESVASLKVPSERPPQEVAASVARVPVRRRRSTAAVSASDVPAARGAARRAAPESLAAAERSLS